MKFNDKMSQKDMTPKTELGTYNVNNPPSKKQVHDERFKVVIRQEDEPKTLIQIMREATRLAPNRDCSILITYVPKPGFAAPEGLTNNQAVINVNFSSESGEEETANLANRDSTLLVYDMKAPHRAANSNSVSLPASICEQLDTLAKRFGTTRDIVAEQAILRTLLACGAVEVQIMETPSDQREGGV